MAFDEKFWVFISFVIFVLLIIKPLTRTIVSGLDNRSQRIKDELERAVALREEAQAILADYKRKQQEALREAQRIIEQAESASQHMLEQSRIELEEALNRRVEMAMQKIAHYESLVLQEVRGNTVDLAIRAVTSILQEDLKKDTVDNSIELSIAEIDKRFH